MASKIVALNYFEMETKSKDVEIKLKCFLWCTQPILEIIVLQRKEEDITKMPVEDRNFMTLREKECSKEENITKFL